MTNTPSSIPTSYAAGNTPEAVAAADLTGDGTVDLVVADLNGGVDVLVGNSTGTFGAPTSYAAGSEPVWVTTADLTGDGTLDLIVADLFGGVDVLMGTGNGTFGAPTSYAAGVNPKSVTTAEIDGHLDLVVADNGGGVSVLQGNGNGTFDAPTSYAAGSYTHAVVAADLNGDGIPDLVVTDNSYSPPIPFFPSFPGGVYVLLGNSTGTFGQATSYAAGGDPEATAVADVNGDGIPDFIVADYLGGVEVLLGKGDGTFGAATSYAAGTGPLWVTTADVNGDGKPDILVADNNNGGVDVLLNQGNGTFGAPTSYAAGSQPDDIVAADLARGSKQYLAVSDYAGGVDVLPLPCYARGTRIWTERGEVLVECLQASDRVILARGGTAPVRWLGHRRVDCRAHPDPRQVMPVRIVAAAFGEAMPARDLFLSPDHAVFIDGMLIPIRHLINGHSIAQVKLDAVEYWHVELCRHDILLAEGLPAESYLDTGNRASFANGGAHVHLHPEFAPLSWDDACAELIVDGPRLVAVKERLFRRSGTESPPLPGLALRCGGRVLPPNAIEPGIWRYVLPPRARHLNLHSPAWVPAMCLAAALDHRRLGVRLFNVAVDDRLVPLTDPIFRAGFHAVEATAEGECRWTDGRAQIRVPEGTLSVTLYIGDGAIPISALPEEAPERGSMTASGQATSRPPGWTTRHLGPVRK